MFKQKSYTSRSSEQKSGLNHQSQSLSDSQTWVSLQNLLNEEKVLSPGENPVELPRTDAVNHFPAIY